MRYPRLGVGPFQSITFGRGQFSLLWVSALHQMHPNRVLSGSSFMTWFTMKVVQHMTHNQAQWSLRLVETSMPCSCQRGCGVLSSTAQGMKVRRKVDRDIRAHSVAVSPIFHLARWLFVVLRNAWSFIRVVVIMHRVLVRCSGSVVTKGPARLRITHDLACGLKLTALKAMSHLLIWKAKVCCHRSRLRRGLGGLGRR